jgi:hypothetical protein
MVAADITQMDSGGDTDWSEATIHIISDPLEAVPVGGVEMGPIIDTSLQEFRCRFCRQCEMPEEIYFSGGLFGYDVSGYPIEGTVALYNSETEDYTDSLPEGGMALRQAENCTLNTCFYTLKFGANGLRITWPDESITYYSAFNVFLAEGYSSESGAWGVAGLDVSGLTPDPQAGIAVYCSRPSHFYDFVHAIVDHEFPGAACFGTWKKVWNFNFAHPLGLFLTEDGAEEGTITELPP